MDWLAQYWGWLLLSLAGGACFCFYVMLSRERRTTPPGGRAPADKDC